LEKVRARIRAAAPQEATEGIHYGMPVFQYKGSLVGYAAFARHCSFFPMNGSLVGSLQAELVKYKTSKGTIQVAVDKPLPGALIRKMVKMRVAENEEKG
jgi:uncharacterized protein YdhG (YjbR/CyaY superfamily)